MKTILGLAAVSWLMFAACGGDSSRAGSPSLPEQGPGGAAGEGSGSETTAAGAGGDSTSPTEPSSGNGGDGGAPENVSGAAGTNDAGSGGDAPSGSPVTGHIKTKLGAPLPGAIRQPALPQMLQSLDRLAALEVAMVYPGHGVPFDNHRLVIAGQQMRIRERTEECWRLLAAGTSTVAALFDHLYGARGTAVGLAGLWMVVGYLDLLVAAGRATVAVQDRVWHYQALETVQPG